MSAPAAEAGDPACLTLAYLAEHRPGLRDLVIDPDARADSATQPGPNAAASAPGGYD